MSEEFDFDFGLGFADDSDPNKAATEFDQYPEGPAEVNGIFGYATTDDEGMPFYKDMGGRMAAVAKLRLIDGGEGPPMTCSAADLTLLVIAFGGDIAQLPKDRSSVPFMMSVIEQANAGGRKQTAQVSNKGWVNFVTGANLPTDRIFRVRFEGARNKSGKTGKEITFEEDPKFKKRNVFFEFKILGSANGSKTPYDGATISLVVEDPFLDYIESDGRYFPKARKAKSGASLMGVKRMAQFIRCFWPEMRDYEWEIDATRSEYGTNEADNPLPVIVDHALRGARYAQVKLDANKTGRSVLRMEDLLLPEEVIDESQFTNNAGSNEDPVIDNGDPRPNLTLLADYIESCVAADSDAEAFKTPGDVALTKAGADWCKDIMVPIWIALSEMVEMPEKRKLIELNEEQAGLLLQRLAESRGEAVDVPTTEPVAVPEGAGEDDEEF